MDLKLLKFLMLAQVSDTEVTAEELVLNKVIITYTDWAGGVVQVFGWFWVFLLEIFDFPIVQVDTILLVEMDFRNHFRESISEVHRKVKKKCQVVIPSRYFTQVVLPVRGDMDGCRCGSDQESG